MALFNNNKQKEDSQGSKAITTEEIKTIINQNCYSESDNIEQLFGKYDGLCMLDNGDLDKQQKTVLHNAKVLFVNSITPSKEDKQWLLDFVVHALSHVKSTAAQDALQAVSKIGITALKTVSVAGKVATLGMGGKVIDNVEKVTNKAIQTNSLELVKVWRQKIDAAFENAKKLEGGLLSKDKEFSDKIKNLRKQYEGA